MLKEIKHIIIKELLKQIPEHKTYADVFGNSCSIFFAKNGMFVETFNDWENDVVNLFRVLREDETLQEFKDAVNKKIDITNKDVIKAVKFFNESVETYNLNKNKKLGFNVLTHTKNISQNIKEILGDVEYLPEIYARLIIAQIEYNTPEKIIKTYDTEQTLLYVDTLFEEHLLNNINTDNIVDLLKEVKSSFFFITYKNNKVEELKDICQNYIIEKYNGKEVICFIKKEKNNELFY